METNPNGLKAPVPRLNSVRTAARLIEKLDAELDGLRPADRDVPAGSRTGEAWTQVIGAMQRVVTKCDRLVDTVVPLRVGRDMVNGKMEQCYQPRGPIRSD